MLGYCQVVQATAHIKSQITVRHLGNYNLSSVNKMVDTCMCGNVNRNGVILHKLRSSGPWPPCLSRSLSGPLGHHRCPGNQLPPLLSSLHFPHGGAQCQARPFHLFFCLPRLLPPWSVPCMILLASPDDFVMWPYHLSSRCLTVVRRSSWGPMACRVLFRTSSLEMWSLYVMPRSFPRHLISSWSTSVPQMDGSSRVEVGPPYMF